MMTAVVRSIGWIAIGMLWLTTQVHATVQDANAEKLQRIIAAEHRSLDNKARDKYRNPLETLSFFGVRDDMVVVEIYPGGGWYTEILAPFLRDKGTYYAAGYDAESHVSFFRNNVKQFENKLASKPALYGKVKVTELAPPKKLQIAPPGSADVVLTFRNVHNWMKAGNAADIFAAMYRALKPGGVLGLVEHRGNLKVPQDTEANSGYVNEDYAIKLAQAAGFKLIEKSEINANPNDTKDYAKGVWTLPPTLVDNEVNKEKYLAIGESDRMTLKFVKPAK